MSKHHAVIVFTAVLFLETQASCINKKKLDWNGSVEEVNGLTIVNNPNEPLYGELVFDLEEDMSIGNVQSENYIFSIIHDIEIDKDGNIYVLEASRMPRIQKFDPTGKFLCTFGRIGQGPGEFQSPRQILIDDKKSLVAVKDIWKLLVFDKDGKYMDNDIAFDPSLVELWIDAQGFLWGIVSRIQSDTVKTIGVSRAFAKLNISGQIEKVFDTYPYRVFTERRTSGIAMVGGAVEFRLHASPLKGQGFVYGNSDKYELNVIDLDGNPVCKIKKNEPFQYFTNEEKNRSSKIRFPEYKPFFYGLLSDSEGRIYVQKNNSRLAETGEKEFDIFSKDGFYIYKTKCSQTPFVIEKGFFYTRIENIETGDVFVKRYKIQNWDKIEKSICID